MFHTRSNPSLRLFPFFMEERRWLVNRKLSLIRLPIAKKSPSVWLKKWRKLYLTDGPLLESDNYRMGHRGEGYDVEIPKPPNEPRLKKTSLILYVKASNRCTSRNESSTICNIITQIRIAWFNFRQNLMTTVHLFLTPTLKAIANHVDSLR